MIKTKKQLYKQLNEISDKKIRQGILFKEMALSIEQHYKNKTLKECLKIVNSKIELEGGIKE